MTRTVIPGAWYGDNLPSGVFCAMVPNSHVQTHLGIVPLPDGEPWGIGYPRCTDIGGFRCAGQAHSAGNLTWELIGSSWRAIPGVVLGISPVIYDNTGALRISQGGPVGSQGYRYVTPENVLVTGDQTYGPFNGLSEYTALGDGLWIGQGHELGGVLVWDGSVLRRLEDGICTFVRANRVDDRVALAFTRPEGVVLIQTTMAALRALPRAIPNRVPGPVNTNEEPKKEPMATAPNVLTQIRLVFQTHPEINTREEGVRGQITTLVVQSLGGYPWGRKSRDGSAGNLSDDALCYRLMDGRFEIYDIINGGDGSASFNYAGTFRDGENGFFFTVPTAPPVEKPPVDKPPVVVPPPAVDLSDILRRLEKLEGPRKVAIRTDNGRLICAEGGGGGVVNATREHVGGWETFTLEPR